MTSDLKEAFPPVIGAQPALLILGSMPSERSLELGQYYGHPRNAFWPIMGALLGFDPAIDYDHRCAALAHQGIALWDVIRRCRREGSLDASIERDSIEANDFAALLERHPGIRCIAFNGAMAEQSFRRLVLPELLQQPQHKGKIQRLRLPSSSPAHASLSLTDKITVWRRQLTPWVSLSQLI